MVRMMFDYDYVSIVIIIIIMLLCYYYGGRTKDPSNHHASTSDPKVHEMVLILGKSNGFSGMFRN